uniref:Fuzzy planar cell polarity protein n=1 Tax=Terrapene triunguis TaxID=2587831 RepID=A0A674KF67_9SAUR
DPSDHPLWLVGLLPPHAARDYPIYLPHGSPTVSGLGWGARGLCLTMHPPQVPHRLLTCQLLPGLEACLICGPTRLTPSPLCPQLVPRFWKPLLEPLQACVSPQPHGLPPGITLPPGVLA